MERTLVMVSKAAWPSALLGHPALLRLVHTVVQRQDWSHANSAPGEAHGGALVLADMEALAPLVEPAAPSPRAAWYVVGLWDRRLVHPQMAIDLHSWGVREFTSVDTVLRTEGLRGLLTKAYVGAHGVRVRQALLEKIDPRVRPRASKIFGAALEGIVCGERSVPALARRVFRSRSDLERFMRSAGLVPPSKFIQRTRLLLALQLRDDRTMREDAYRVLGFRSAGRLAQQFRAHFDLSIRDADALRQDPVLALLGGRTSRRCQDG